MPSYFETVLNQICINHWQIYNQYRWYLSDQGCRKRFRAGGANRVKGASRTAQTNRGNRAKEAFCHILLFLLLIEALVIKTSKIWCTLAPRIKNLSFSV